MNPIDQVNATAIPAYSDGTADTQNHEAFERLLSVRKGRVLATQAWTCPSVRQTILRWLVNVLCELGKFFAGLLFFR
jgi:hypothetical protein